MSKTRLNYTYYLFVVISILGSNLTVVNAQSISAFDVCEKMFEKSKTIKSLQCVMQKEERIDGEMQFQKSFNKVTRTPFCVYLKQLAPKEGLEVLFIQDKNDNRALINTNGFPWMNLNLDPYGSMMRKNQHHTIYSSGYGLVISILEYLFNKYGEETKNMATLVSQNDNYYEIIFNNPHFKYIDYTVKKGQNILDIANQYKISEYIIVQLNESISDYYDVKEGDVIRIPNDYSPKMELKVDKKLLVPLHIKVYDDKGLFEEYSYSDIILNPKFTKADFDKNNEAYDF